jgi:KDO2-lipid IV(A) lauroyltransferase
MSGISTWKLRSDRMLAPILFYIFIYPITLLPFRVIYLLSDGLFYLIYYLVPYRKSVVVENLRNSFPEKSSKEIKEITKNYYRHFCDLTVESFKMFSITDSELRERFIFTNTDPITKLFNENRSVILAGGHYNNWEVFAVACKMGIPHKFLALYKPLSNKWFDKKMKSSRGRFGLNMWSIFEVSKMFEVEKNNLTVSIFAIDQSPSNPNKCHWVKFLNQDTGVSFGSEKYAKENNFPVVYGRIHKIKRGHYSFDCTLITDHPNDEPHGKILEDLSILLEKDIIAQPEFWLWTHKRWKRKKPEHIIIPPVT